MNKLKRVLLLLVITNLAYGLNAATLTDKNGQVMRGTPMILGKPYAKSSGTVTTNIESWRKVKNLGFNTVRVAWVDPFVAWDPNWTPKPGANWSVDEVIPYLDIAVANATKTGTNIIINYHHVGEFQRTRGFGMMAEFWRKVASRYKDNDLVYYELNNEQAWNDADYKSSAFMEPMRQVYQQVRRDAPQRHIIMFSFHSMALNMKSIVDQYSWIDWSNTSVGFHFYGAPNGNMNQEIAHLNDLLNNYPTICTEWDYLGEGHNYVKRYYGYDVNAQALEELQQSSIDWRGWGESDLGNTRDKWVPDAKQKGYWWGGNNGGGDNGGGDNGGGDNGGGNGDNTVVVRARGTSGGQSITLRINNQPVQTWSLSSSYQNYSVNTSSSGDMLIEYTNDQNGGDVQIDYLSINGQVRQAEDQTYNTGAWANGQCGGGTKTEWLHCNGGLGFGSTN
ncbi:MULTISPECIES: cellulase family glycosylhydrolase [unclassified Agarivorans]|uniref:cellulase family glycosylhydrolase n=1 Tax=unclassified Agarivorans TaxID=2636026 RepID=UPI0026E3E22F|nr:MULTISPECIES: cellulase family glycosylhydrolase [unclassified Agarivorans]MDO6687204.1 carbohydrate-binding domain-containing protein [Agarivorans sp. 3_MG-2023]MDO6716869.1 carbohydrate-binding domain-containing protein [Agarivorans sp. 2_MG-2023]MDO6765636.1 carbohydrate-binding domain-containing protein [Agarivorans sp. 1_MG-2023]